MIFSSPPLTFLKLSGPKSTAGEELRRGGEAGRVDILLRMFPVVLGVPTTSFKDHFLASAEGRPLKQKKTAVYHPKCDCTLLLMKHHEISFCLQKKDKKKRLQQILVLQQLDMFMLALKDRDLKNLKPNTLFLEGEKGHEDN